MGTETGIDWGIAMQLIDIGENNTDVFLNAAPEHVPCDFSSDRDSRCFATLAQRQGNYCPMQMGNADPQQCKYFGVKN